MVELEGRHILLLQGPAGPFFARVARQLQAAGARVTKVNFNGGDVVYFGGANVVLFHGSREEWPEFFERLARERGVHAVLLFGDCRPLHRLAIAKARAMGLDVFVFEEGYLRPDFVTLERDGVNGHSRIPRDAAAFGDVTLEPERAHRPIKHAFFKSAVHTIVYACAAHRAKRRFPAYLHHRDIRPIVQMNLWLRGAVRRIAHTLRDRELARRLEAQDLPPYFFVPLQVHLDSQLVHSPFSSVNAFIREVVTTFAEHAPKDNLLILKLHPMDRAYSDYAPDIEALRLEHGLGDRLLYADIINVPAALRGARGTVVINSTVGLSSLTHDTPVKCLGTAIYDVPGLTHQGSLAEFFRAPTPVDRALYKRFRQWLLERNQLNGSVWSRLHESPAHFFR